MDTAEIELKDGNTVAVWLGYQPSYSAHIPGFHLFNTTRPILKNGENLPAGATVTAATLNAAGYSTPRIPAKHPTPKEQAADLHHDERTEGFSKRHFRTNPHDQ